MVDLPDGRRIEYAYDSARLRREKRIDGRLAKAFRWRDPLRLSEFYDGRAWRGWFTTTRARVVRPSA